MTGYNWSWGRPVPNRSRDRKKPQKTAKNGPPWSGPVFRQISEEMDRFRFQSFHFWPKNRTGPDLKTLVISWSSRQDVSFRICFTRDVVKREVIFLQFQKPANLSTIERLRFLVILKIC